MSLCRYPIDIKIKIVIAPIKQAETYNSLTKTIGISLTNESLNTPPPVALRIAEKVMARKLRPNNWYAKIEPIAVNTPRPTASNFKNKSQ